MKIGIDLGGTNMRVALIDGDTIKERIIKPCPAQAAEDVVTNQLINQIQELMCPEVKGIGMGVPSIVDTERGIVYNVNNIPSWREVHLKEMLEQKFGVPAYIENDANTFALGVYHFGEGRGTNNMVGLVMGTGIGSGIVIGGEMYHGMNACAGEIGSLLFKDKDFEYYCSSRFFSLCHGDTGKNFGIRAQQGDESALAVWREFGQNVGELMKAIMFVYAPDAIVIGGGISSAFHYFESSMRDTIASFPFSSMVKETRIVPSTLQDAALLGASALVK